MAWLGVVRHGQSLGNVAADRAERAGAEVIDIDVPDPDVALSEAGERQAEAIGRWWAELPPHTAPTVVVASPYRRAADTARIARTGVLDAPTPMVDERLRDRELGVLDRLTRFGVATHLPEEEARRLFLGKFYYRPPGGESWADVALRLRALLNDLHRGYAGERVLLFGHEAIVFLLRYLVEGLTIAQVLHLAHRPLANAGRTSWHNVDGQFVLETFDDDSHVRVDPVAPQTRQPQV